MKKEERCLVQVSFHNQHNLCKQNICCAGKNTIWLHIVLLKWSCKYLAIIIIASYNYHISITLRPAPRCFHLSSIILVSQVYKKFKMTTIYAYLKCYSACLWPINEWKILADHLHQEIFVRGYFTPILSNNLLCNWSILYAFFLVLLHLVLYETCDRPPWLVSNNADLNGTDDRLLGGMLINLTGWTVF